MASRPTGVRARAADAPASGADTAAAKPAARRPSAGDLELARRVRTAVGSIVWTAHDDDELPRIWTEVLTFLHQRGPATGAELATYRRVRPQTVTPTIKDLQAAGLIEGRPDAADGRKVVLHLTVAGRTAVTRGRDRRLRLLADAIRTELSGTERERLGELIDLVDRVAGRLTRPTD